MKLHIDHVAKLANIPLKKEEKEKLEEQLNKTLSYVDTLSQINTEKVKETSQVTGLENVFREDEVKPSLSQEEALKNSKSVYNGYFKIKAILKG